MNMLKVFIVGPAQQLADRAFAEFGHENVHGIAKQDAEIGLRKNIRALVKADVVVTIDDWHTDADSDKLIRIARLAEIDVVHHSKFKDYAEQRNG